MKLLQGKTAIITGASRGIGKGIAEIFAKNGANIAFTYSSSVESAMALEKELNGMGVKAKGYQSDASDFNEAQAFVDAVLVDFETVDILINNAGYLSNELFSKTSYESFKDTFDVNVFGLAEITRSLIPYINKTGHVVNISSIGGVNGSKKFPGLSVYSSSKAAVIALTEVLAEEYSDGPSFNVLALGAVQTKMLKEAFPDYNAETNPNEMAKYIIDFAVNGSKLFNGKLISVSNSNP